MSANAIKAIFLDLDETLCDTTGANLKALGVLTEKAHALFGPSINASKLADMYLAGIYRKLDERYRQLLLPVTNEKNFRLDLIRLILNDLGISQYTDKQVEILQTTFDHARTEFFDFFPGIKELLIKLRSHFTLVVITNGPEFSQVVKVETVKLGTYVDYVIIGGQEKEQKPAKSIFEKALKLAGCSPAEAIHIGDSLEADIQGAINSNIQNVWISHGHDLDESLQEKGLILTPDHIIETPFQLEDLLKKIAPA